MIAQERQSQDEEPIDEVVGKINPREPDVIQALRRTLRVQGKAFNTEKAYVQKVLAFMEDRGLKNLSDFECIRAADIESHLTDLAVDGNVAPSTQNQAFYALLFLSGIYLLIGQLLYGCGMRISECLRLRVKDIDFDQMLIEIHNSKGDKSRFVPLPRQLSAFLRYPFIARRDRHSDDSGVAWS